MNPTPANRIELSGPGVGEVDQTRLEKRAIEIAHSDGRSHPTEKDRFEARQALSSLSSPPPEDTVVAGEAIGTGVPPSSTGSHTPSTFTNEEDTMTEDLVREGIEEADLDTRARSDDKEHLD